MEKQPTKLCIYKDSNDPICKRCDHTLQTYRDCEGATFHNYDEHTGDEGDGGVIK